MKRFCNVKVRFLWLTVIFLGVSFAMLGQADKGKQIVRKYVEDMGRITVPAKSKIYYMDMEVTVIPRDMRAKPISKRMQSYLMYDKMIYDSEQITIMQDREAMYVLLHETRKLLIDKSALNDSSVNKMKQMLQFQKTLIDNCNVSSCSNVKDGEKELVLVSLIPKQEFKENLKIDKISVYFTKGTEKVAKVIVYYDEKQKIKTQEVRYRSMDFNYRELDPNISVRDYVYEDNGLLKDKYRSYEVFDKRK